MTILLTKIHSTESYNIIMLFASELLLVFLFSKLRKLATGHLYVKYTNDDLWQIEFLEKMKEISL